MSTGALNYRVRLQARQAGQDAAGQPVQTWADVATLWADVRHQSGLQAIQAGADVSTVRASARIRYRAGVDAGMRLVIDGRVYEIEAVLPDARRAFIDLVVKTINLQS